MFQGIRGEQSPCHPADSRFSPQFLQVVEPYNNNVSCCGLSRRRRCADLDFLEPFDWTKLLNYEPALHQTFRDAVVGSNRRRDYSGRLYDPQARQSRIPQLNRHHRRPRLRRILSRCNAKQRNVCDNLYPDTDPNRKTYTTFTE
jgi:hypothetical protein